MALHGLSNGMARSKLKPGPDFDPVRRAIKAAGHRVTPYRLGSFSHGLHANPYTPGSQAHGLFNEGAKWARQTGRSVLR